VVNLIHIGCSFGFAFGLDLGIVGIAYASVLAQYTGVALSVVLLLWRYRGMLTAVDWRRVMAIEPLKEFFRINRDIMLRTLCNVAVYTFFTGISARMGDRNLLAINTLLMQLFTLFSYMADGFAYAAEALTGRFIGARDSQSLRRCIKLCLVWCFAVSFIFIGVYVGWWRDIFTFIANPEQGDSAVLLSVAEQYIGWIIAIPLAAAMPFVMDGIMVGATRSRIMRNSMIWSSVCFFVILYGLGWLIGNNALWLAFTMYMFLRGVFQYFMSDSLRDIYRQAEQ
jgi:MATE family multidrug resistance protein